MKRLLLSILSLFILSGCSSNNKAVHIKEHTIQSKPIPSQKIENLKNLSIKIRPLMTNEIYNTNHMWYQQGSEFTYFAYNQWAIPPIDMIRQQVQSSLIARDTFRGVLTASTKAKTDLTLEIEIVEFYQVFNANESHAVMEIKVNLISNDNNKLLKTKVFYFNKNCQTNDPNGGVKAFEELFVIFSNELVDTVFLSL